MSDENEQNGTVIPPVIEQNKLPIMLGVGALLLLVVFFLPEVQALTYTVLVASPSVWYWLIISSIVTGIVLKLTDIDVGYVVMGGIVVAFLMSLLVGPLIGSMYAQADMANQIESQNVSGELPDTTEDHVRVLPREVADNYAQSSIQKPQYRLTKSDLAYQDGKYRWSYGVVPDNLFVSWFGNQFGTMYVDMEKTEKETNIVESKFKNGRGQIWFDSYEYTSVLSNPTALHQWGTTFNTQSEAGENYIAHSTVSYEWKFRFPQIYAVPQFNTVEVMNTDGNVESLSPEEAQNDPRLEKQNFYPYDVAMFKVDAMQYKNGIWNKHTKQEGVLEISDLPSRSNQWPLTVPTETEDGFKPTYFVATEAVGSGDGVYEVWSIDAQTGELTQTSFKDSQIGPQKAVKFVERQSEVNRLSNAYPSSPIPIVKDSTLYWHVKVVPGSDTGIIYTAFVNAKTGDVTLLEGTDPIYAFLSEDEVKEVEQDAEQSDGPTTTVTVAVTDKSGEIIRTEEVEVPQGGQTEITVKNPEENQG